ncbi:hypothetical protein DFH09DRAFT_1157866 [Mycena vulgaris]|nr:hypothetical protein DFH09DRAFT_1366827 [Mycena vulgaris]KAJ6565223.1 hypothetical protein DFH09DRAFT_1157866 [Mycena vulgaris]
MSDDTYQASSPAVRTPSPTGSYLSLALDYEPSQNDQWVREEREALLSKEERAAGALSRHRKRQRRGYSPLTSPIKEEEPAPLPTPRSTVEVTNHALKALYASGGFLDSQTGDGTYVDNLYDRDEAETQTQGEDLAHSQDDALSDSDFELEVQIERLRVRLNIALEERDTLQERCNEYKEACAQANAERASALAELKRWQQAATAASSLIHLSVPYVDYEL